MNANQINEKLSAVAAKYGVKLSPELEYPGGDYIFKIYRPSECFLQDVEALERSGELELLGWNFDPNGNIYADIATYELDDNEIGTLKENPDTPIEEIIPEIADYDFDEIEYTIRQLYTVAGDQTVELQHTFRTSDPDELIDFADKYVSDEMEFYCAEAYEAFRSIEELKEWNLLSALVNQANDLLELAGSDRRYKDDDLLEDLIVAWEKSVPFEERED